MDREGGDVNGSPYRLDVYYPASMLDFDLDERIREVVGIENCVGGGCGVVKGMCNARDAQFMFSTPGERHRAAIRFADAGFPPEVDCVKREELDP